MTLCNKRGNRKFIDNIIVQFWRICILVHEILELSLRFENAAEISNESDEIILALLLYNDTATL